MNRRITVSVVSHGQIDLVENLLDDLAPLQTMHDLEVIVTSNVPEKRAWRNLTLGERTHLIQNTVPLGFGANHNQAFAHSSGEFFCIVNPDIRLAEDPFPVLVAAASAAQGNLVSPAVLTPDGSLEDHARTFPSIGNLIRRRLQKGQGAVHYSRGPLVPQVSVDWLAGMFLIMPRTLYEYVGGFDERYFMYCEDIDLSAKVHSVGNGVLVCPRAEVIHDARRASGQSWRHTRWHIASMARLFAKWGGRFPN